MPTIVELAATIVSAHATNSFLSSEDLLKELCSVHETLKRLDAGAGEVGFVPAEEPPALTLKQAFRSNEIICMICGRGGMKTLSRHLRQAHDMKPGQYRKQFSIPGTQPLTAKKYSEVRRARAEEIGLAANLVKAREVRMANIQARRSKPTLKKVQ